MKKEPKKPSKMTGIRTKISLMMVVLLAVIVLTLTLTLFFSFRKTTAGYILDALETAMEINGDSVEELMERIRTADELVYPMGRVEENNLPPIAGMIVRFDPKKDYSDLKSAGGLSGREEAVPGLLSDLFRGRKLWIGQPAVCGGYLSARSESEQNIRSGSKRKWIFFCPESKDTGLVPEDDPAGRRKLLVYQNRGTGSDLCVPPVKNQPVCGRKPDGISARSPCPAAGRLVD